MEWIILISLLVLGMLLIVAEIIFIPGTTFVGILGFICLVAGIYSAFANFGSKTGNIVLFSSAAFLIVSIIYIFKAKTWEKMALKDTIDSRVNENKDLSIYEGCIAMAVSDLKPIGTIEFENEQYEAETNGEFIDRKSAVKVLSISKNQILVEQVKH